MSESSRKIKHLKKEIAKQERDSKLPKIGDIVSVKTKYGKELECVYGYLEFFPTDKHKNYKFSIHEVVEWKSVKKADSDGITE